MEGVWTGKEQLQQSAREEEGMFEKGKREVRRGEVSGRRRKSLKACVDIDNITPITLALQPSLNTSPNIEGSNDEQWEERDG